MAEKPKKRKKPPKRPRKQDRAMELLNPLERDLDRWEKRDKRR